MIKTGFFLFDSANSESFMWETNRSFKFRWKQHWKSMGIEGRKKI